MEKAKELLAANPEKAATLLTASMLKRIDALEEQTKFLVSKHFVRNKSYNTDDFEFAVKYGSIGSILEAIRQGSVGFAGIKEYLPLIRQRKDADMVIKNLQQFDKTLKGGKTYRRKLKRRKQTRRQ